MSAVASYFAYHNAPVEDIYERMVLVVLADHCDTKNTTQIDWHDFCYLTVLSAKKAIRTLIRLEKSGCISVLPGTDARMGGKLVVKINVDLVIGEDD